MKQQFTRACAIALMMASSISGFSQYQKTVDLGGDDYGNSAVVDANGNHYIAGSTTANGATSYDAFITKVDALGNPLWEKQYGGSGTEYGTSIMQTSDGNLLLTGRSNSFGSSMDFFVVKTDTSGTVLWAKTFGTDSVDYGVKAAEDANGYLIIGSTKGAGNAQSGTTDILLVYVNASGTEQWTKTLGANSSSDYAFDVIAAPGAGFAVLGYTGSSAFGGDEGCAWIVDATGAVQAAFLSGGNQHDEFRSVLPGPNFIYIAGNTNSYGAGQADYWLTKWSLSNGPPVILWTKTYGGAQNESLQSAAQLPDGNIILLGLTNSFGTNGDGLAVVVDTNGSVLVSKSFGGTGNEVAMGINVSNQGALILGSSSASGGAQSNILLVSPDQTGSTPCNNASASLSGVSQADTSAFSNFTTDTVSLNIAAQSLTVVAHTATTVDLCTGTGVKEITSGLAFNLYPNPAANRTELVVYSDNTSRATVSICNYLGQTVSVLNTEITAGKNTIALDLTGFAAGMYFVKVSAQQAEGVMPLSVY